MHAFFHTLEATLSQRTGGDITGSILFEVLGPGRQSCLVTLSSGACRVEEVEPGFTPTDVTIFCDTRQLDDILGKGATERPFRYSGRREIFDALVSLLQPGRTLLAVRRELDE